ncbi:hypothetical protein VSR82_39555, partial [Burkholderia sp. JPY481]
CTAASLNSAVYTWCGTLNISSFLPFGRVYTRPAGRRNFRGSSRATGPYASPLLDPRDRSPVCLALTARDIVRTQEDLDALYAHLVEYNLYIYTKLHLPTRSFRIGCMGCIDPMWIRLLGIAFEDFFSASFDESGSHPGRRITDLWKKAI